MNKLFPLSKDLKLYLRLLTYTTAYWPTFVISIISTVIVAATDPMMPALLKIIVDEVLVGDVPDSKKLLPLLFIVLFAVRGIFIYISGSTLAWVASKVIMDLQNIMFERLIKLPKWYFDEHRTGELLSKFTFDINRIQEAVSHVVTIFFRDLISIIGLLAWMFYINWTLTLIIISIIPFILLIIAIIKRRLRKMSTLVQQKMATLHHWLEESIKGNKLIKIYGGQANQYSRFKTISNQYRRYQFKFSMAAVSASPAVQFIMSFSITAIIYVSSWQITKDTLTIGEFVSFFTAIMILIRPLKQLVTLQEYIQKGLSACESVFAILDERPEPDMGHQKIDTIKKIHFQHITFCYPNNQQPTLCNFELMINSNEHVALVGLSGSGKTTLAYLLPRFYDVDTGKICINDINICQFDLRNLRQHIAYVGQDIILFDNTIRYNIAFGELDAYNDEQITDATKAAHALEFINKLPDKLDTKIGENGLRLSGGQRQRIAIARAFLKQAPILILDEATSSLDNKAEQHIQMALNEIKIGRTCLIIAHRLSTVKHADRIVVVDKGRIIESGTHQQLLTLSKHYAKLYQKGEYFV